jgi:glycine cleavage system H protein
MEGGESNTLYYKRSHFVTRLPVGYRYTPSHCWLSEQNGIWRVGLTKFATRMLGEMVDYGFECEPDSPVQIGQTIGWIEGFKAVSDLLCVVLGRFARANPDLSQNPELVDQDCYGCGWLYEAQGKADELSLDVRGYRELLDSTIDQLAEKHRESD